MKQISLIILLIFGISHAQFFESSQEQDDAEFFNENNASTPPPEPGLDSRGDDFPTGPGDVPINNWIFLLPLAGIAIGAFYLSRRKTEAS